MSLKELRNQTGMSQTQIAERAGITLRQYQRYELGQASLKKAAYLTVERLAACFHITPDQLVRNAEDWMQNPE